MIFSTQSHSHLDQNGFHKHLGSPDQESNDYVNRSAFKIFTNQKISSSNHICSTKINPDSKYSALITFATFFNILQKIKCIYDSQLEHGFKNQYTLVNPDANLLSESKIDILCFINQENYNLHIIFRNSENSSDANRKANIVLLGYTNPDYLNKNLIKRIEKRLSRDAKQKFFFPELDDCNFYFFQNSETQNFSSSHPPKIYHNVKNKKSHKKPLEDTSHPTYNIIDHSNNDSSNKNEVKIYNSNTEILDVLRHAKNDPNEEKIINLNQISFFAENATSDTYLILHINSNIGMVVDEITYSFKTQVEEELSNNHGDEIKALQEKLRDKIKAKQEKNEKDLQEKDEKFEDAFKACESFLAAKAGFKVSDNHFHRTQTSKVESVDEFDLIQNIKNFEHDEEKLFQKVDQEALEKTVDVYTTKLVIIYYF